MLRASPKHQLNSRHRWCLVPSSQAMLVLSLLFVGPAAAYQMAPSRMAGSVQTQPRVAVAQLPTWNERSSPAAHFRMQVEEDIKAEDIYDDFMGLDESGAAVPLGLDEKEKLYLECLDSFYNEGGKAVLPDNKYEQLKVGSIRSPSYLASLPIARAF